MMISKRDASPVRPKKERFTLVQLFAGDRVSSLSVRLNSNVISDELKSLFNKPDTPISVEHHLIDEDDDTYTNNERKLLLGFLVAIGFSPENIDLPEELPKFEPIEKAVADQEPAIFNQPPRSDCKIHQIVMFTSETHIRRYSQRELTTVGEFLLNETECEEVRQKFIDDYTNEFVTKMSNDKYAEIRASMNN
jgi:hypothetical protein